MLESKTTSWETIVFSLVADSLKLSCDSVYNTQSTIDTKNIEKVGIARKKHLMVKAEICGSRGDACEC
jgi:hypothetical protein